MSTNAIFVRPISEVARTIQTAEPDLVVSVNVQLPAIAKALVDRRVGANTCVYLFIHNDDLTGSNITNNEEHPYMLAIRADEAVERHLGRTPRMLIHCLNGEDRSAMTAMAVLMARIARGNKGCSLNYVYTQAEEIAFPAGFQSLEMFSDVDLFKTQSLWRSGVRPIVGAYHAALNNIPVAPGRPCQIPQYKLGKFALPPKF